MAENYTKLGTYIKRQQHKDLIQYRAALSEQKAKLGQIILTLIEWGFWMLLENGGGAENFFLIF